MIKLPTKAPPPPKVQIWHWSNALHEFTKCPDYQLMEMSTDCCAYKVNCTTCLAKFGEMLRKKKKIHTHSTHLRCGKLICSDCPPRTYDAPDLDPVFVRAVPPPQAEGKPRVASRKKGRAKRNVPVFRDGKIQVRLRTRMRRS